MKKKISQMLIVFFISLFAFLCVPQNKVEAADDQAIVFYQAIVKTSENSYSAVNAVSQYYYSDPSRGGKVANKSSFKNLIDPNNICSTTFGINSSDRICNRNTLNPVVASASIAKNGDVKIVVENGYMLSTVRISYILAKENVLFCGTAPNYTLCETAKTVDGSQTMGMTAWKSKSRSGFMSYSTNDILDYFSLSEADAGRKTYLEYNIINQLPAADLIDAQEYGIYATMSLTVQYIEGNEPVTYYLNDFTFDDRVFETMTNTNASTGGTKAIVNHTPTYKSSLGSGYGVDGVSDVSAVSVLIRSNENKDINKNAGFNATKRYFDENIRPIIAIVVGVLFLVVGTSTGVSIVKSSDEPEERRMYIKRLIGLFVGALIIYVVLFFYADIISAFSRFFG